MKVIVLYNEHILRKLKEKWASPSVKTKGRPKNIRRAQPWSSARRREQEGGEERFCFFFLSDNNKFAQGFSSHYFS